VALGFIGYDKGKHGEGIYHVPNKFRLTYRPLDGARGDGSHEWRRIDTIERAGEIAEAARNVKKRKARKSISPVVENVNSEGWIPPLETKSPVVENTPTRPMVESTPTSISRDIGVEGEGGPEPASPARPKPSSRTGPPRNERELAARLAYAAEESAKGGLKLAA
jgi:hypothetical protein